MAKTASKVKGKGKVSAKAKAAPKAAVKASPKEKAPVSDEPKVKAAPKAKAETKDLLNEEFLKQQAYHGTRNVPREVGSFVKYETENTDPISFLDRVRKNFPKAKFTTATNIAGVILRMRTPNNPKAEVRLITHESFKGMIGVGRPIYLGSPTKTNGKALEKAGKLDGLKPQPNKVGKYWWFNANSKNEKVLCKFISEIGF